MKTKRTLSMLIICMLIYSVFSVGMVYAPKKPKAKTITELIYDKLNDEIGPTVENIDVNVNNIKYLTDNTHDWGSITQALDDIKDEISTIEEKVVNNISPQLDEIDDILNKLDVEALCYETLADPGNDNVVQVCVSVTSFDGQAVLGLTIDNFFVYSLAGESPSVPWQVEVVDIHYNGFVHTLLVKPNTVNDNVWGSGPYIFGVQVTQGFKSGRTLTTVTVT